MSDWISLEKEFPEMGIEHLMINSSNEIMIGTIMPEGVFNYIGKNENRTMDNVSHWQPLPDPPEPK